MDFNTSGELFFEPTVSAETEEMISSFILLDSAASDTFEYSEESIIMLLSAP